PFSEQRSRRGDQQLDLDQGYNSYQFNNYGNGAILDEGRQQYQQELQQPENGGHQQRMRNNQEQYQQHANSYGNYGNSTMDSRQHDEEDFNFRAESCYAGQQGRGYNNQQLPGSQQDHKNKGGYQYQKGGAGGYGYQQQQHYSQGGDGASFGVGRQYNSDHSGAASTGAEQGKYDPELHPSRIHQHYQQHTERYPRHSDDRRDHASYASVGDQGDRLYSVRGKQDEDRTYQEERSSRGYSRQGTRREGHTCSSGGQG
ncbi:unnamed protein product, partial [Amoebophrya sp. A25]